MTTVNERPLTGQLDSALDVLVRQREELMAEGPSGSRAAQLARVCELEARVWQALFEHARTRVQWRAALAAEAYARMCARHWRRRVHGAQQQRPTGFLLVCGSCQITYEPSVEDLDASRTGCPDPDCGGWTIFAELVESAAGMYGRGLGGGCRS